MQIQYIEDGIKMTKILCIPIRMKPNHADCYFPDKHIQYTFTPIPQYKSSRVQQGNVQ